MADKQYEQEILNIRERPLSSDLNAQFSQALMSTREQLKQVYEYRSATSSNNSANAVPQGFLSDGFHVDPGSGMQVILRNGLGSQDGTGDQPSAINGIGGLNDLHPLKPLVLSVPEAISVPSADPTNPRWDIIEVKYRRAIGNPQTRGVLNTSTGVFDPTLVNKTMSFVLDGSSTVNGAGPINYKTGTPAASPSVPTTDAGYIRIGRVYVPALAASISTGNIIDDRRLLVPGGNVRCSGCFDVNPSNGVISNAYISAPPGVDAVVFTYLSNNTIGFQILGPFPGVSAINRGGEFNVQAATNLVGNPFACVSSLPPSPAPSVLYAGNTPISVFPTGVLGGGGPAAVQYNSVYFATQVLELLTGTWSTPIHTFTVHWQAAIPVV